MKSQALLGYNVIIDYSKTCLVSFIIRLYSIQKMFHFAVR
jgi:hypothetical protein